MARPGVGLAWSKWAQDLAFETQALGEHPF
jgi:hypothetical protein